MKKQIEVSKIIDSLKVVPLYDSTKKYVEIDNSDINRPGLQLAGFFEYFGKNRVQLFGMAEITYMQEMDKNILAERLNIFFSHKMPFILIARNLTPPYEFLESAKAHDVPVFMSGMTTTKLSHSAILFLDNELAPIIARHGGLMDIFGIGVFITGESGVGKSETSLELIKRGHRFVADDVVEIKKLTDSRLVGCSPDVIRHLMEIRGIGLIDVSIMYGMGSVMPEKDIDMCVYLQQGGDMNSNRLNTVNDRITLLGIDIPKVTIPVMPGRNIAIIIEVAAMNQRLKTHGYNAKDKLNQKIIDLIG